MKGGFIWKIKILLICIYNGTAVVYGEFEVDNYRIHIETAGDKSELETLCKKTAEEVFKLIENSSLDFEVIK